MQTHLVFPQKCHNLTLANWTSKLWPSGTGNQTTYDKLRSLESFQFTLLFRGTEKSRLKGGKFVFLCSQSSVPWTILKYQLWFLKLCHQTILVRGCHVCQTFFAMYTWLSTLKVIHWSHYMVCWLVDLFHKVSDCANKVSHLPERKINFLLYLL